MTTRPPKDTRALAARGVRLLGTAAAAVTVASLGAAAAESPDLEPWVLLGGAVLLAVAGWRWPRRGAVTTTAVVAAAALAILGVRALLEPTGEALDLFLLTAGAAVVGGGLWRDERRLVALGLLQWAVVAGRPRPGSGVFRHCLYATDVAVPLPRLDLVLLVGLGAVVAGSLLRWQGQRAEAGRGFEITGLSLLLGGLVVKASELGGLEVLCGDGDALDEGWFVTLTVTSVAAAVYGVAGRDAAWTAGGVAGLTGGALVAATLQSSVLWSVVAGAPVVVALIAADRAGVPWPSTPGYGIANPLTRRPRRTRP